MKIIAKKILVKTQNTRIIRLKVSASNIAPKAMPGQFVVVMAKKEGERIPLTIVEKARQGGVNTRIV